MKQINPLVSIIIPVYNGANYLGEAIDSALAQTYKNVEVIVVNDGSRDLSATEKVAKSYGKRIRYFRKKNGRVASALNFGIKHMRGKYFSWLSHDDIYYPNKIAAEIALLNKYPSGKVVVFSDYDHVDENSQITGHTRLTPPPPEDIRYYLTTQSVIGGCTLLIPKSCFAELGYFDKKLITTQDYAYWFKLAHSYSFRHVPKALVKSRHHSNQDSVVLSDTAAVECDELVKSFFEQLNLADIKRGSGKNILQAYYDLAANFHRRRFYQARNAVIVSLLKLSREKIQHLIRNQDIADKFAYFYHQNVFSDSDSISGAGSSLSQTKKIGIGIVKLLKELKIKSIVDAPCGDLNWIKHLDLGKTKYLGVDIVGDLITINKQTLMTKDREFICANLTKFVPPKSDLILCRDCFVHLSYADIKQVIKNFRRSGSKYLLTTTFTSRRANGDLDKGIWRPLNLELSPFSFPKPLKIINEGCTEGNGQFNDKSLGLWKLQDIKV